MELTKKKKIAHFSLEDPRPKKNEHTPIAKTPRNTNYDLYKSRKYLPEYLLSSNFENETNVGPPRIGLFDQLTDENTRNYNMIPLRSFDKIGTNEYHENVYDIINGRNPMQIQENSYNHYDAFENYNKSQFTDNIKGIYQSELKLQDLWITVFGFNSNDINDIINFFTVYCGRIVDKKYPPQRYNWIEIKFELPYQVVKALKYNGKIINGSTMIGVIKSPSECNEVKSWSYFGSYDSTKPLSINNSRMFANWNMNQNVTNRSNGLMTRFFELIFGLQ